MHDRSTILDMLNKFSNEHENISWNWECVYSDGLGMKIDQILMFIQLGDRTIGKFAYNVGSGQVLCCNFKDLKGYGSQNIVDLLLDMMNHFKSQKSNINT